MRVQRGLLLALLLAVIVVPLGAYVRLSDAGLGCPDWPGCYGKPSPLAAAADIARAMTLDPDGPVSHAKAWKEMVHRYLAASLGLVILAVTAIAFKARRDRLPASLLLALVVLQGLLGMWTVTLLLKPAIVTGHLLGGMLLIAALAWWVSRGRLAPVTTSRSFSIACGILIALVFGQIALGGWVSTHYAALACQGFPSCNGELMPSAMRFDGAFHGLRSIGEAAGGAPLAIEQRVAIHWTHRLGALLLSVAVLGVSAWGWRWPALRGRLVCLLIVWLAQVAIGVGNVLMQLPLPLAVAHNAGALLLLVATVRLAASLEPVPASARSAWAWKGESR
ncbi:COX15/CtaA family protein [Crenobacter cavernae]|uniref:COX15/CtaA family protein n=1 Tax=Crenobacter cavernae TaxID=2290923 RepID=UPI001F0C10F2|nr:COX15/CtaA family protein [Crenobacter cavernae]